MKLRAHITSSLARTLLTASMLAAACQSATATVLPSADGFYGIWYSNEPQADPYVYKYSGGMGTYTHQTSPLVMYSEEANRTYFVYGGTNGQANTLRNYISYYDHDTKLLARPREVRNQPTTNNNHRNATLTIDDDGYLYVFGNSHGNTGTGNMYRSTQPYETDNFEEVPLPASVFGNNASNVKLAYSSPNYWSNEGLAMVYNQYDDQRAVHIAKSTDGINWTNQRLLDTNSRLHLPVHVLAHMALEFIEQCATLEAIGGHRWIQGAVVLRS